MKMSAKRQAELRLRARLYPLVVERDTDRDGKPCCVPCGKLGTEVHEVLGRGLFGHKNMTVCLQMKNMVVICPDCHRTYHNPAGRGKILRILAARYGYDYSESPFMEYLYD